MLFRIILFFAIPFTLFTASAQMTTEEASVVSGIYGKEKRTVYLETMNLQPNDSVAFWPLYNDFEDDRKDLGKTRIAILQRFAASYPAISNDDIHELVDDLIDTEDDINELRADYYSKIKDVTSAMVAAKFFIMESLLETQIQSALRTKIPFVERLITNPESK